MTLATLLLLDLVLVVVLDVVVVRPIARCLRRRWGERRLGLLSAAVPTAEAARAARLRQLGEAGTYRVYNCGTILHVCYEQGELIIEREGRHK
jgi:hypothetical protein